MKRRFQITIVALCLGLVGIAKAQPAPDPAPDESAEVVAPTPPEETAPAPAPEAPATEEAPAPTEEAAPADKPVEAVVDSGKAEDKSTETVNPAEDNPTKFSGEVWGKFMNKEWGAAVIGLLILLITLFRAIAGRVHGWFKTKSGGYFLNLSTTFALTLLLSRWAGVGWSIGLVPAAFTGAMAVSGGRKALLDFVKWFRTRNDPPEADTTGE